MPYPCDVRLAELPLRLQLHTPGLERLFSGFRTESQTPAAEAGLSEEAWQGLRDRGLPEAQQAYTEYFALIGVTADALLPFDRCVFHGAAFLWRGKAWLLTAPSGTGKTTMLVNWQLLYGDETRVINGDKPILRRMPDETVWVYPSPWKGKERLSGAIQAPLGGIVLLQQSGEDLIRPASKEEAVGPLYDAFFFHPSSESRIDRVCALESAMLASLPVWTFDNRGCEASARMLHDTLVQWEECGHAV